MGRRTLLGFAAFIYFLISDKLFLLSASGETSARQEIHLNKYHILLGHFIGNG
jgi:hypothetical protein